MIYVYFFRIFLYCCRPSLGPLESSPQTPEIDSYVHKAKSTCKYCYCITKSPVWLSRSWSSRRVPQCPRTPRAAPPGRRARANSCTSCESGCSPEIVYIWLDSRKISHITKLDCSTLYSSARNGLRMLYPTLKSMGALTTWKDL